MLSKFRLQTHFQTLKTYLRYLNSNNHFRAVENENHDASNEQFKYKTTQTNENVFSQRANVERSTTFVEKIQVLSSPTEFVKNHKTMSDVSRDRLGQWPVESESELSGQGLQRLKNGRFNKVSEWKKRGKIDRKPSDDCDVDYYETNNFLGFANSSKNKLLPINGWCCKPLTKRKIKKLFLAHWKIPRCDWVMSRTISEKVNVMAKTTSTIMRGAGGFGASFNRLLLPALNLKRKIARDKIKTNRD